MSSTVMDRARPAIHTAGHIISGLTARPPSRREKITRGFKRAGIPMFIMGGIGAIIAFARSRSRSSRDLHTK